MNKALVYILVVVAAAGWIIAWKTGQTLEEEKILRDNYVKASAELGATLAFEQGQLHLVEGPGSTSDVMVDGNALEVRSNAHQDATKDLYAQSFNEAMTSQISRQQRRAQFEESTSEEAEDQSDVQ